MLALYKYQRSYFRLVTGGRAIFSPGELIVGRRLVYIADHNGVTTVHFFSNSGLDGVKALMVVPSPIVSLRPGTTPVYGSPLNDFIVAVMIKIIDGITAIPSVTIPGRF